MESRFEQGVEVGCCVRGARLGPCEFGYSAGCRVVDIVRWATGLVA
jgi:hypothetical protein